MLDSMDTKPVKTERGYEIYAKCIEKNTPLSMTSERKIKMKGSKNIFKN